MEDADPDPPVYEVNVKCIDGSTTRLEVPSDLRGADLKELICERTQAPPDRQRLICRGKVVKDDDLIGQHITESGQTLHMVQRPGPPQPQQSAQPPGGGGPTAAAAGGQGLTGQQVDLLQLLGFGAVGPTGAAPAHGAQPGGPNVAGLPPAPPTMGTDGHAGHAGVPAGPPPLQIVFQQGLGNLAHVIPMLLGEAVPAGDGGHGRGAQGAPAPGQGSTGPAAQGSDGPAEANRDLLPWRDLRRLHGHLARLLGRGNPYRTLPPVNMPAGEWHSFLSVLLGAMAQLSVAISDLQASLVEGTGPQPRHRLQLAMALVAAARTLRGVATNVQSGVLEGVGAAPGARGTGAGTAVPLRGSVAAEEAAAAAAPRASSDSEEDALEHLMTPVEPAQEADAPPSAAGGGGGGGEAAPQASAATSAGGVAGGSTGGGAATGPSAAETSPFMQMLPQIFGQLAQTSGSGGPTATDEVLDRLPSSVASAWREWTQPGSFRRVVSQALQPPLSEAYISGDATGSHHSPSAPPPEDFLSMRWRGSAERVEGPGPAPEPPEHLSRAYLSAILRDLGRHMRGNATYASVPDPQRRWPHLAQLAGAFSEEDGQEPATGAEAQADAPSGQPP